MNSKVTIEDFLAQKNEKLSELNTATVLLKHRHALADELLVAKSEVDTINSCIRSMRQDLKTINDQNSRLREFSQMLEQVNQKIILMQDHLSTTGIDDLLRLSSPSPDSNRESTATDDDKSQEIQMSQDMRNLNIALTQQQYLLPPSSKKNGNGYLMVNDNRSIRSEQELNLITPEHRIEDCRKNLFKTDEDSYSIDLLNEEEFSKIPKYMIGRQTLANLNEFVTSLNGTLAAKYGILALGKVGARKKGKLDVYLSLKRGEIPVGPGEDPIYFFTAEDFLRHTQCKLDKGKLNLLTVLRHCKRIKELRVGKNLQYVLIPSWKRHNNI